jgi:aerobic carbon-monoxide dehydrogenase medium subunit
VKPPAFDYQDPRTLDEAVGLLAGTDHDITVLAGGQSLVPLLNLRLARPDVLLDLNRVPGLDGVEIDGAAVRIGAMARLATLERDAALGQALPILPEAIALVAHPQIRNRTTVGGSLCHADPAAELPAVAVALDARLHLRSHGGSREVPAVEFFKTVFTTSKRPDELLTAVEFPRHDGFRFCFEEVSRRHGDFPFVGLCFGVALEDGVVTAARLAGSGVGERPLRLPAAEAALVGLRLSGDLTGVLDAASAEVDPPSDIHGSSSFRRGLLRAVIRRAAARLDQGGPR